MFVRVKRSGSAEGAREYLQIVESRREGTHVRQRVVATLGRRDQLVGEGTLDALLASLAKFSERLRVVEVRTDGIAAHTARSWGPALVFERLWREQGVDVLLRDLARASLRVRSGARRVRARVAATVVGAGPRPARLVVGEDGRVPRLRRDRVAAHVPHRRVAFGGARRSRAVALLARPRPVLAAARPDLHLPDQHLHLPHRADRASAPRLLTRPHARLS